MTGIEDRIGSTTAGTESRTAGFLRGAAVVAALALAMIAALALSEEASAHGTGYYGSHTHGGVYCGSGGRISVMGLQAAAYNGDVNGHVNYYDEVYYRAHLYRWNGSRWAYVTTDGWAVKTASRYGNNLVNPTLAFAVYRGHWRVTTEMLWYDGLDGELYGDARGNVLIGSSPNAWAQGTCAYG